MAVAPASAARRPARSAPAAVAAALVGLLLGLVFAFAAESLATGWDELRPVEVVHAGNGAATKALDASADSSTPHAFLPPTSHQPVVVVLLLVALLYLALQPVRGRDDFTSPPPARRGPPAV
jgi:hypothetical protein